MVIEQRFNDFVGVYHDQRWSNFGEDAVLFVAALQVVQDLWFVQHVHVAHIVILFLS